MDYRLGKVTSVIDPLKFVIKFTIDIYIEDAIAYPIDTFDETISAFHTTMQEKHQALSQFRKNCNLTRKF